MYPNLGVPSSPSYGYGQGLGIPQQGLAPPSPVPDPYSAGGFDASGIAPPALSGSGIPQQQHQVIPPSMTTGLCPPSPVPTPPAYIGLGIPRSAHSHPLGMGTPGAPVPAYEERTYSTTTSYYPVTPPSLSPSPTLPNRPMTPGSVGLGTPGMGMGMAAPPHTPPSTPTMMTQQQPQQYGGMQAYGGYTQGQAMVPSMQQQMAMQGMPAGAMGPAAQMAGMMAAGYHQQQQQTRSGQLYEIQFGGMKLDKKDLLSKSDPFLILKASTVPRLCQAPSQSLSHPGFKTNPFKTKHDPLSSGPSHHDSSWVITYRTETVMNNQSPTWKPFTIDTAILCHNNIDQPFLIEVYDWNRSGSHEFIGSAKTTLRELMTMREARLTNNSRIGFSNTSGIVTLLKCLPISGPPQPGQVRPPAFNPQLSGLPTAPPANAIGMAGGTGTGTAAVPPMM